MEGMRRKCNPAKDLLKFNSNKKDIKQCNIAQNYTRYYLNPTDGGKNGEKKRCFRKLSCLEKKKE